MHTLTDERLTELLAAHTPPCISLYLPTERGYPSSPQNSIRYRNLLGEAEGALRREYPGSEVQALL